MYFAATKTFLHRPPRRFAEVTAIIYGLERAQESGVQNVDVEGDTQVVFCLLGSNSIDFSELKTFD